MKFIELTEEEKTKVARTMIQIESQDCFDVCNHIGQMFDNIKYTQTMQNALIGWLELDGTREYLRIDGSDTITWDV